MAGSVAILAAVAHFFIHELALNHARQNLVVELRTIDDARGPCAGLSYLRTRPPGRDPEIEHITKFWRQAFAQEILGERDLRGQSALLGADHDGLIDKTSCLQFQLTHELGEDHPILGFLRFSREAGDPCQEAESLLPIFSALSSHRNQMLTALMQDADRMHCVPAPIAAKIAAMVATTAAAQPDYFDQLDTLRIASFLDRWAPEQAARLACRAEVTGQSSELAKAVGCTPDALSRVLTHFRVPGPVPPAGTEVVLLAQDGEQCNVRPLGQPPQMFALPCASLVLASDVSLAVLLEPIAFGTAKADLIAGIATFSGTHQRLTPSAVEPTSGSWFAYDRHGQPAGVTHLVDLRTLGAELGEEVPENPLRANCRRTGARFCYDVDWVEMVEAMKGEAEVYLSRPMPVFLTEVPPDHANQPPKAFVDAFGRPPQPGSIARVYSLGQDRWLVIEARPEGLEARWRLNNGPWRHQEFGAGEKGQAAPAARLIATLDVSQDHRPDLLVQRVERQNIRNTPTDVRDEIVLLRLDKAGQRFVPFNRLTVREY